MPCMGKRGGKGKGESVKMKVKKLLVTFLLGVSLCFVPVLGYGEVEKWTDGKKTSYTEVLLLLKCQS